MAVVGDIARTSRTGAGPQRRLDHSSDDDRVASHPQIVVGAPDDDLAACAACMLRGVWPTVGLAFEVGESPIAVFATDVLEKCMKMST